MRPPGSRMASKILIFKWVWQHVAEACDLPLAVPASGRLGRPEQVAHEVAQGPGTMAGHDPRLARGRRHHEAAQRDDLPRERIPFAPGFARFLGEDAAHHLW